MMKKINWKPVLRLTIAALVFLYVGLNIGLAWIYVERLVHVACKEPVSIRTETAPEVIAIQTEDGLQLEGWYYAPQNGAAILSLGGVNGALGASLPPVAFLIEHGYGVLQLGGRNCAGALSTLGGLEAEDAVAAVRWLENQADVERIGAFGFSMGGVSAIRASAASTSIEAVVAEGGYFNLGKDIVEVDQRWNPFENVMLYSIAGVFWFRTGINPWLISPVDDIGSISPRPVFLIYGEQEQDSGRAMQQFDAASEPKEIWIVPSGNHGTNYFVAQTSYEDQVLDFFDTWLLHGDSSR